MRRAAVVVAAVVLSAALVGVLVDTENWFGDDVSLAVAVYVGAIFIAVSIWSDARSIWRRR